MSKHKLLLADDSITIQKVVNLTFADEGIEVISVGDGNSAMAKFEELTPDLVMADINMPGLSGYEICERIKGNAKTRSIPVILLVGSFEPFDETEAQRVGANDYLTKPFQSIRQLVSKVSDLLNASPDDEATEAPVNSFDDTLRMDEDASPADADAADGSDDLNDVGTDDEMIQSFQVGNFQFDETSKYESHDDHDDPEIEDEDRPQAFAAAATDFSSHEPDDSSRAEENSEQKYSDAENAPPPDATPDFSARTDVAATPMPERASILDLDDMDLLELPPRRIFSPAAPIAPAAPEIDAPAPETAAENVAPPIEAHGEITEAKSVEASDAEPVVSTAAAPTGNLSPEIIDAIAAKVVEKLSDQVIREIAWEVVPQMTDLIVKRMAEEKLKE